MYPRHMTAIIILLAIVCPALPCLAETVLLDEIVVRGETIPPQEEILTVREVRESSARDIGEALADVPGIAGLRKGAIANDIVLRGLQRDNINVLMDGVRVQGGCPSRMDPPAFHFDFAEVESIEIVKGPYDLRYAGSMGGLVNAIGKTPEPGPGLSAVLTYGSYDMLQSSLTASHATEDYSILAGYAYKYSLPPKAGNGKRITDIYPQSSKNRYREKKIDDKAYDINTFWVKGGYQLTAMTHTELSLAHQDAQHVLYPALLMDAEHDRTNRLNWTTTVEQPSELIEDLELQFYVTDVDHLMHDEYRESSRPNMMITRDYMMETDADTTMVGLNLSGTMALGDGLLRGGIDGFYRNWDATNKSAMYLAYADQAMIPDVEHNQFGLFSEYAWDAADKLEIKVGLRLDYAESDATDLSNARLNSFYQPYHPGSSLDSKNDYFEPTANLQFFYDAGEGLDLFAGVASASRMPDPEELYIGLQRVPTMMVPMATSWVGNPNLDPTRNNQFDLGAKLSGGTFFLNGSVYYSRIDDYITLVEVNDPDGMAPGTLSRAKTYSNIDAELWGGEISGQVSLPLNLFLSGSLAYTEGEDRDSNEPLAEIPPLSGTAAIRYDVDTWFFEIQERFADKQGRVNDDIYEEKTSGWGVTDLKAGANLVHWKIFAGVNNLFDKYYVTALSYQRDPFRTGVKVPETGAFAYLTVMYQY